MFGRDSAADDLQDVEDAVGELTNIIGGNLKALVSSDGCSLSLPEVTERSDYLTDNAESRVLIRQVFASEGEPVVVSLLKTERH